MLHLFQRGVFKLHSGQSSSFKIECDALGDEDWMTLAHLVSQRLQFSQVVGVPEGGLLFAAALQQYCTQRSPDPVLIADDVLTTGKSMTDMRADLAPLTVIGVVAFARGECPSWRTPVFQMWQ